MKNYFVSVLNTGVLDEKQGLPRASGGSYLSDCKLSALCDAKLDEEMIFISSDGEASTECVTDVELKFPLATEFATGAIYLDPSVPCVPVSVY